MNFKTLARNLKLQRWLVESKRNYSSEELRLGKYKSVVGLEVHTQILSNSKLFSAAPNDPSAPANTAVSLFDAATPGTLPRINRHCVESAVRTAMRLPLAVSGNISFFVFNVKNPYLKSSSIHQIQLEQDSGKSIHFPGTRTSLLDLNRAGVPLMEIVFEPDLSTGEEAAALLRELALILTRLEVCSCKPGALRCDANISIHKPGEPLGVRSEVKNIASVRAVAKAIEYEIARHVEVIESGGKIVNETRSWDDETGTTIRMRDKEVVQDYRFMPEPNLPPLNLASIDIDAIRDSIPEMPDLTRDALSSYNLRQQEVEIMVKYTNLLNLFLSVVQKDSSKEVKNLATTLLKYHVLASCNQLKIRPQDCPLTVENFSEVMEMLRENVINVAISENVIFHIIENPTVSAKQFVEENNQKVIRDSEELRKLCKLVIEKYDKVSKKARRGKEGEFDKLVKALLKESNKRADIALSKTILQELLKSK
ncbi:glutamyl-tRNA(Gln) amidotransferase subunit B, mitochondrial isoform X1 [Sitodiplosis mosellana]|uniref:glutamyl-tRNA(Gln) amidotransferase subunit B, mitochondrial isoform X1 n=1 Tax=Sitodiplosis mosellana TaxID=263140 RepID=UPI002443D0FC|nr:glutamyl-tRNA(Gln) amidotransferase subunit B, mitochondrial isoform X1 [Sitodiplosis mosellana]